MHSDRILLFRDGAVVADGPPPAVIEDEERWMRATSVAPR